MDIRWAWPMCLAAAVCGIAAGCSGDAPSAATPTASTSPARTQAETTFLDRVHTAQAKLSDDDALESGRMTCADWDTLRDGHVPEPRYSPLTLENLANHKTLTTSQARAIEQAAVENLCPANLAAYQKSASR
ncbi:DUF732 domain-containing protein [Amycolatopsis sp. H6(2020)]|nr:DUF732 domain-containing protein [Amycolatopsis sp. H6(2020)]